MDKIEDAESGMTPPPDEEKMAFDIKSAKRKKVVAPKSQPQAPSSAGPVEPDHPPPKTKKK